MSDFKGKSKKDAINGEVWNPTSTKIKGKDGKEYSTRHENPQPGKEPERRGYYLGYELIPPSGERQNDSKLHRFQDEKGEIFKVWGCGDLDDQLSEVQRVDGLGTFCLLKWNGYLVKSKCKNKPETILAQKLPADHYHDWEVIAGDHTTYPPIKVDGAEVYKPQVSNQAPPPPSITQTQALPETLPVVQQDDFSNGDSTLPY